MWYTASMKTCSRCHLDKPLDQFAPSKLYGHQSFCRACQSDYAKEYRAKNPDKVRKASADYHVKNRDKRLERAKADYQKNAEEVKRRSKDRYQQNREAKLATNQRWRVENPERMAELNKQWRSENPERARINSNKRRVRALGAAGSHTAEEWEALKAMWGYRCAYCGIALDRFHEDHVVPLTKGGTDGIENILPSCGSCNHSKSDSMLYEWIHGVHSKRKPI